MHKLFVTFVYLLHRIITRFFVVQLRRGSRTRQMQQKPAELGINWQTTVRAVFKQAARDFANDFAKANAKAQLTVSFKERMLWSDC